MVFSGPRYASAPVTSCRGPTLRCGSTLALCPYGIILAVLCIKMKCSGVFSRTCRRCHAGPVYMSTLMHVRPRVKSSRLLCRADESPSEGSSDGVESLFAKELQRRGMANQGRETVSTSSSGSSAAPGDPFATSSSSVPRAESSFEANSQLQRSRKLNSEGLEGLVPRASLLVRLGGTFFLGFLPIILALSIAFGSLYAVMGDQFIHDGSTTSGAPPYIDPYELLSEPTVDPYYPVQ